MARRSQPNGKSSTLLKCEERRALALSPLLLSPEPFTKPALDPERSEGEGFKGNPSLRSGREGTEGSKR